MTFSPTERRKRGQAKRHGVKQMGYNTGYDGWESAQRRGKPSSYGDSDGVPALRRWQGVVATRAASITHVHDKPSWRSLRERDH